MSKEVDVTLHSYVRGLINKQLVMELDCNGTTYYCYTISDLVSHLIKLGVSVDDIWSTVLQVESKYYKLR